MKKTFFQQALFPNNKVSNTKTYKKCGRLYSRLSTYVKKWSKEQQQKIRSRKKYVTAMKRPYVNLKMKRIWSTGVLLRFHKMAEKANRKLKML